MNDLVNAFKKLYEQLVLDRKAHCHDFRKALMQYTQAQVVHTKNYTAIIENFCN